VLDSPPNRARHRHYDRALDQRVGLARRLKFVWLTGPSRLQLLRDSLNELLEAPYLKFRAGPCGEYPFERISEITVQDGFFNVFEYLAQLLSISSRGVVRNLQVGVFDQGDDVTCIGEAAAVKLDGNQ